MVTTMALLAQQSSGLLSSLHAAEASISTRLDTRERMKHLHQRLKSNGVFSSIAMHSWGFRYIGIGDMARCDACNLEISDWTRAMSPYDVHAERSPNCPFIRSMVQLTINEHGAAREVAHRQTMALEIEKQEEKFRWKEIGKIRKGRRFTFSHWPTDSSPSAEQMIAAGFFSCGVDDRTICLYCNLICQHWTSDTDDPSEAHKIISPQCPYVLFMLVTSESTSTLILNDLSTSNDNGIGTGSGTTAAPIRSAHIDYRAPCHPAYSDITKRLESFSSWSNESSPSVDDLARAGFFYTGTKSIVTCFYCNGSLQNWGAQDNPAIEHGRWFETCVYAKQLCGETLLQQIRIVKRARQGTDFIRFFFLELTACTILSLTGNAVNRPVRSPGTNDRTVLANDQALLSRLVAARLDMPISQYLLNQQYKLPIIRRCWEDQLRLKGRHLISSMQILYESLIGLAIFSGNDFSDDSEPLISCVILQKQIDHIQGLKENIVIPSIRMKQIREQVLLGDKQASSLSNSPSTTNQADESHDQSIPTPSPSEAITPAPLSDHAEREAPKRKANETQPNSCLICCNEERQLACIPCGHLIACVPCSHSLLTCPVCRKSIEAFVRIFV